MGGDGQQAGKDNRLPRPLQVAVFNDYRPVPGMKVRFTIQDNLKGKLEGEGPGGNPVEGVEIVVASGADGVAECNWTLDPAKLGTAQTVEARLLDAKEHPDPILQPIRFNAHIERADGIKVTRVLLSQTKRALPNDGTIRPTQLLKGIDLVLDREVEDLVILSRASCYVTVEAPCDLLGEQLRAAVGDVVFLPLVLNGTPKLDGKTTIHWEPNESTGKLLESWEKAPSRLLARLTFLGNFLWDKDKLYLDGDTFGSSDPEQASKLVLPSGDGRVGGDFRMWFWLERSPLRVSATSLDLPNAVAPSGESSQDLTLGSTQHVSIKKVEITQEAEGPFSVAVATPFDITPGEEDRTITVKFAPKTAAAFDGTLKIEGKSDRDSFDIKLHGVGQNV